MSKASASTIPGGLAHGSNCRTLGYEFSLNGREGGSHFRDRERFQEGRGVERREGRGRVMVGQERYRERVRASRVDLNCEFPFCIHFFRPRCEDMVFHGK